MSFQREEGTRRRPRTSGDPQRPYSCHTCGESLPREFSGGFREAPDPVHCEGSRVAYQVRRIDSPHHGRLRYPACWRCGQSLGCDQCGGAWDEVLCTRCAAWGTPEALAKHGPIRNDACARAKRGGTAAPQVRDYPPAFRAAYGLSEAIPDVPMPSRTVQQLAADLTLTPPATHTAAALRAQAAQVQP